MTSRDHDTVPDAIESALNTWFPARQVARVLLVNPPDCHAEMFRYDAVKRGRGANYPPYGLLVLAERLRRIGIEVSVLSLNHEILKACKDSASKEDFRFDEIWHRLLDRAIEDFKPDLIGVGCMFTMTHMSFRNVCERAAATGIPVVIGGVHTSNDVDGVLKDIPWVRAALVRECDNALPDFVRVVNRELPVAHLSQIVLNAVGGPITIERASVPTHAEIDVRPAWDLFDTANASRYGLIGIFGHFLPAGTRCASVLSNRGCRAQCTFCSVRSFNGKGVRQREIESVLDELALLKNEYGIGHVMWLDDDLLKDERRAVALFNGMVRRNLGMTWDASNGVIASSCTEEVVEAMAASGCVAVNIGMESGDRTILKRIKKPGTVENFIRAAELFGRHPQIYSNLLLMLGFPGETLRMMMRTLEAATAMNVDWCRISPLQPLPNTPIFDEMVALGLIDKPSYEKQTSEVRFTGGVFGTQVEREQGLRLATANFRDAFANVPLDRAPRPDQIADIWFYMNFYMNFHRLFRETRPIKMQRQITALRLLADYISPDNAFALYFLAVLQQRMDGAPDAQILSRLEKRLESSPYWSDRFHAFGLSLDDFDWSGRLAEPSFRLVPQGYAEAGLG